MSTVQEQRRLHLEAKAVRELKERLVAESFLSVKEACGRLAVSRDKLEGLPFELLPYTDLGFGKNQMRRYHPADVQAFPARARAYQAARSGGEGEAYLQRLREEREAREAAALRIAQEMGEVLHVA